MTADREPRTEAGRRLLNEPELRGQSWWLPHILDIEAEAAEAARAKAGHRIESEHDCFLMDCRALGRDVLRRTIDAERLARALIRLGEGDGRWATFGDRTEAIAAELAAALAAEYESTSDD